MKIPVITGLIRRRILVNYRVAPAVVESLLPSNFRPKLVNGWSIAGICLIRLEEIRPKSLPKLAGISSENCAHRIAVEWDDPSIFPEGSIEFDDALLMRDIPHEWHSQPEIISQRFSENVL